MARERTAGSLSKRFASLATLAVLMVVCLNPGLVPKLAYGGASFQPIIIDKVDPWSPLKGLDGVKPCLTGAPDGILDNWAFAWIEVHNTTNETLVAGLIQIDLRSVNASLGVSNRGYSDYITLSAGQDCLIPTANVVTQRNGPGGSEGDGPPPGADKAGIVVSIYYSIENRYNPNSKYRGGDYQYSTPALSDPYGDSAYWQLGSDGKWSFIDPYTPRGSGDENQTRLISTTTDDGSIIVNATIPKLIRVPSMFPMHLTFQNATTKQLLSNVGYKIKALVNPSISQYLDYYDGSALNGTDIKYPVVGQNGTFVVSIKVTSLGYNSFERSKNAGFSVVVVPEFGSDLMLPIATGAVLAATIISFRLATRRRELHFR